MEEIVYNFYKLHSVQGVLVYVPSTCHDHLKTSRRDFGHAKSLFFDFLRKKCSQFRPFGNTVENPLDDLRGSFSTFYVFFDLEFKISTSTKCHPTTQHRPEPPRLNRYVPPVYRKFFISNFVKYYRRLVTTPCLFTKKPITKSPLGF